MLSHFLKKKILLNRAATSHHNDDAETEIVEEVLNKSVYKRACWRRNGFSSPKYVAVMLAEVSFRNKNFTARRVIQRKLIF